jgi:hypothetical protein
MIFADLASGDSVFVDANTLIYHFGPHPAFGTACRQMLQRSVAAVSLPSVPNSELGNHLSDKFSRDALRIPR